MYRSCLTCTADLGDNRLIETQPVGRKLAFDGSTGRLWVVCPSCGKWNLVPLETRLESIDDCERLFRATATRYATDQIGLARHASGLTLIRVGKPVGEEFASWRYGETFRLRRKMTRLLAGAGTGLSLLSSSYQWWGLKVSSVGVLGYVVPIALVLGGSIGISHIRKQRDTLRLRLPNTGQRVKIGAEWLKQAALSRDGGRSRLDLMLPGPHDNLTLWGDDAEASAQRILGRVNNRFGADSEIRLAIDKAAMLRRRSPEAGLGEATAQLLEGRRQRHWYFHGHDAVTMLALEMHANEATEAQALRGELRLLERQWREADALARIADGLVLPDAAEPRGPDF